MFEHTLFGYRIIVVSQTAEVLLPIVKSLTDLIYPFELRNIK